VNESPVRSFPDVAGGTHEARLVLGTLPRIFFSFHYELDHWRARQIRTWPQWVGLEAAGYVDGSLAEESKTLDARLLQSRIDASLRSCAATAVLIGARTFERQFVSYEIFRSLEWKKPLVGIFIDGLRDHEGRLGCRGPLPLLLASHRIPCFPWNPLSFKAWLASNLKG
jgi:hypothetical protein